jgi:hypothetical protein
VQDTALYGLQAVAQMGHGSLQDYVAGVIQKPVLIHAAKMVDRCGIKAVAWFIIGVLFRLLYFFYFVVHYLLGVSSLPAKLQKKMEKTKKLCFFLGELAELAKLVELA